MFDRNDRLFDFVLSIGTIKFFRSKRSTLLASVHLFVGLERLILFVIALSVGRVALFGRGEVDQFDASRVNLGLLKR